MGNNRYSDLYWNYANLNAYLHFEVTKILHRFYLGYIQVKYKDNRSLPTKNYLNSVLRVNLEDCNQVYYYFEANSFLQFVDISDMGLTLSSLTVIILDRFGYNLNPMGLDYSFSLALELWQD